MPPASRPLPPVHRPLKMKSNLDSIILRYVGYALLFLGSAYFLYLARGALPVFFAAGLIAYAFDPVLKILEKRGYSRVGAVGFVFLVFMLLFMLLIMMIISGFQQVQQFQGNVKPYIDSAAHLQEQAHSFVERLPLPENMRMRAQSAIDHSVSNGTTWIEGAAVKIVSIVLSSLGEIMINVIVLPIITVMLMLEMDTIRRRAYVLVPVDHRDDVSEIATSINELLGRYVRGQMVICGLFGALCTTSFTILGMAFGMQYGIALGLIAGIVYIIPYIGMMGIAIAATLTAYLTSSNPMLCAGLALGSCIVFNLFIDYGVSPRVLGKGVGLHPVFVIFALLSGAKVGGIFGMVLAVPVVASLRVVLIYIFPQLTAPLPEIVETSEPPASASGEVAPPLVEPSPEFQ